MDIAVIGGGASGLMASIIASRNKANVTLFESNDVLGKKILVTGNGKCNLSNTNISSDYYYVDSDEFLSNAFNRFGLDDTMSFFKSIGLLMLEKRGGIYPNSEQAVTVKEVLENEIVSLGVNIVFSKVIDIKKQDEAFYVTVEGKTYTFDKVILATGGNAAPKTGSDGFGYRLAMNLGHTIVRPLPALTGLKCRGDEFKTLAGVRVVAGIKLNVSNENVCESYGELQLTDYGLSGIPIFQISRIASKALVDKKETVAFVDFFPDLDAGSLETELKSRVVLLPDRNAFQILSGIMNKKIAECILKKLNIDINTNLKSEYVLAVVKLLKNYSFEVYKVNNFDSAQTTSGGVSIFDITDNMESKICKGLYFSGEIIDVDGLCGGYNLQWAWTSGYIAGESAALCLN